MDGLPLDGISLDGNALWLVRMGDSLLAGLGDLVLLWALFGVLRIRMVRLRATCYLLAIVHCGVAFVTGSPFFFFHVSVIHDGTGHWPARLAALDPLVLWAWLSVVALLAIRRIRGTLRIHRFVDAIRRLQEPTPDTRARGLLRAVARELGRPPPLVVELDGPFATPFVMGWRRPLLVLPRAVTAQLSDGELRAVLAHELAHLQRRDLIVQLLLEVVATVFFFHLPLLRLISRYRAEVEKDCDRRASAMTGDPGALASALVTVLELADGAPTPRCAVSTLVRPRTSQILDRLRHLRALTRRHSRVLRGLQLAAFLFLFPWQPCLDYESLRLAYDPAAGGLERSSRVTIAVGFTPNPFNQFLLRRVWQHLPPGWPEGRAAADPWEERSDR